jgi:hypothetical protein
MDAASCRARPFLWRGQSITEVIEIEFLEIIPRDHSFNINIYVAAAAQFPMSSDVRASKILLSLIYESWLSIYEDNIKF